MVDFSLFSYIINLKKELAFMIKTNIKIKGGIEIVSVMITAGVLCALAAILFAVLTFTLKPQTLIKDDVAATQELFKHIDDQMTWNSDSAYMTLAPTGYVTHLVTVIGTVGFLRPDLPALTAETVVYYNENSRHPDSAPLNVKPEYTSYFKQSNSQTSLHYAINFDQSKVDNIYLIRKIDYEDFFGFNAHATMSHIIFNLNKINNIKPSTSLRLELTPIKMKNGEAYHYFAKESEINTPVAYDTCKDTLDCLYISRYKSTVPRPL